MQSSQLPTKLQMAFGSNAGSGYIRPIPAPSQIATNPGAASLYDGFPPNTFFPTGAPDGRDFNGILNMMSAWQVWQGAGGTVPWDSSFSAAIGGYPKGAFVASATTFGTFWFNTVENNTSNPDSGGAGWVKFNFLSGALIGAQAFTMSGTYTPTAGALATLFFGTGAGGGGGSWYGLGGGSGATAIALLAAPTSQAVVIGTGGTGAGSGSAGVGTAGGTTTVGSILSAGGGGGGGNAYFSFANFYAGAGGTASTGNVAKISGNPGVLSDGYGYSGSNGGVSFWGGGGGGSPNSGPAATAGSFGGGGGGGNSSGAGANGGNGFVLALEWGL